MPYYVYLLASRRNGTLYIGVTNNLVRRVWEHKTGQVAGFTSDHSVKTLVWFAIADSACAAIEREKQMKEWRRSWKLRLIEETNPYWRDLYGDIL